MKYVFLLLSILLLLGCSSVALAAPEVSFTYSVYRGKVTLSPVVNSDVTEYRWSFIGKRNEVEFETEWIPRSDAVDHVTILEKDTYFITITGRNTDTDQTDTFTNQVYVYVKEDSESTKEPVEEESIGSRIIQSLPEPLRSFMEQRTEGELLLMILAGILLIGVVTRRKKIKKYVQLERYHER